MDHQAPTSHPLGESWPANTTAQCNGRRRGLRNALTALEDSFHVRQQDVEGLGPDVKVHRLSSVPHRRRACHPCQHNVVSSQQVLSTSQECTAGSLVCSLGSLIKRFCKQTIVAGAFLFKQLFDFIICFIKPVLMFSGRNVQNFSYGFLWFHLLPQFFGLSSCHPMKYVSPLL